ncbi:MAG: tetratricopeptide repeat protein [Allosphingosinicella sp.]|uniref:tetratricopeptide repeat protein n=1 Tax=Allosphingosinicella sp. TaxID=2823234 RepID=UPI00392CC1E5
MAEDRAPDAAGTGARIRTIAVGAAAFLLLWYVTAATFGAVAQSGRPDLALRYGLDSGAALAAQAERLLPDDPAADPVPAEALAREALKRDPGLPGAYRVLAVAADRRGDRDTAERLMRHAADLSKRSLHVELWLAERYERSGDFARAVEHYDRAIRADRNFRGTLFERLAERMGRDGFVEPLGRAIAADLGSPRRVPVWGRQFLNRTALESEDYEGFSRLLDAVQAAGGRAEPDVIRRYVRRLVAAERFGLAAREYERVAGRASSAGLRDGGFEGVEDPVPPFDWNFGANERYSAEPASAPAGGAGRALRFAFGSDAPRVLIRQLLVLPPGGYELRGRARMERIARTAPPAWVVTCASGGAPLGEAGPPAEEGRWTDFAFRFTVPAGGCELQWLSLSLPRGRVDAEAVGFFDELQLLPLRGT